MANDGEIVRWLSDIADGDPAAAEKVWDRYSQRLISLARKKLAAMPSEIADEEGAVISALRSFFSGIQGNQFPRIEDPNDLWKVLALLTARKAIAQLRHHWKKSGEADHIQRHNDSLEFLNQEPGPEQIVMFVDACDRLLEGLENDKMRRIALLAMSGHETREIAIELDVHQRTVQRKLEIIRDKWLAMENDESERS